MPHIFWEHIEVGEPVPSLQKPSITRVQIARFAGASLDYSPLHIDEEFAKNAGYGSVFAHGAIALAFAAEAVTRWAENARVLSTSATFQKLVWPGDILRCTGVVVNKYMHGSEHRLDVDIWAENQNHDVVMKGQCVIVAFANEKEMKKVKGFPPLDEVTLKTAKTSFEQNKGTSYVPPKKPDQAKVEVIRQTSKSSPKTMSSPMDPSSSTVSASSKSAAVSHTSVVKSSTVKPTPAKTNANQSKKAVAVTASKLTKQTITSKKPATPAPKKSITKPAAGKNDKAKLDKPKAKPVLSKNKNSKAAPAKKGKK